MNNPESLSQLLQICTRKTEDFVRLLDSKHVVWLMEIEEAAKKMFSSDFTAEPELMPKTPSQKRRRKKRTSIVPDENRDPSGRRISRRRSNASWSSSVRRLSARQLTKPLNESIQEEPTQPKRVTRARAQASAVCMPVSEKPLEELSLNLPADRILQVKIGAEERHSAELQLVETLALGTANLEEFIPAVSEAVIEVSTVKTSAEPPAPSTPEKPSRTAAKLKIASSSTPTTAVEQVVDLAFDSPGEAARELALELSRHSMTPTGSKSDRRSVRRSIMGRKSISCRPSLANQYSLTKKRESMTKKAVHKSIRRSISKKKAMENSSSSCKSYQSSTEVVDEEISVKIRPEAVEPAVEAQSPDSPRRSLPTRACKKIAISHLPETEELPRMATRQSLKSDETCEETDDQALRRKSYKRAVDELSDEHLDDDQVMSPPRKKTSSPTCPPSKVVKPLPPHMKTFLHTVQKNQLLMMTPGSISKSLVKSFIKRNTPLKTDPKEKERQRVEALRKKEVAELQRKQKIDEGKKRKQEELKLKREERLRKVLQARERVEQLDQEKKKKVEQKYAQLDEKVREDRMAEEKAKKKITAKKQEDVESRRRQEEEARKLKAKQLEEEEEQRQEELLQKKREEEEQERQKKLAEAKKLAEERERQRELQLAAEREQERLRAEREVRRIEKEKALQLRKELERAAQEKEQQRREADECKRKEQQARLEQERLCKEMEAQRQRVEQQAAANAPVLNVTVELQNSPACESYEMTPKGYKPHPPKINPEDYGMDLNSDDSTDDESRPRKPIPAWAIGSQLSQSIHQQYHRPINVNKTFGKIDSPDLELLFSKSKPRYNKRTSSAVWHSPPLSSNRQHLAVGYGLKKY